MGQEKREVQMLSVGDDYPFRCEWKSGAATQFLTASSNILQVFLPNITQREERVLCMGKMDMGIIVDFPLIMFIVRFQLGDEEPLIFDCPFDVRPIPSNALELPEHPEPGLRLLMDAHFVDSATGILKGLRSITMPEAVTAQFISAAHRQLSEEGRIEHKMAKYMRVNIENLPLCTRMLTCGA